MAPKRENGELVFVAVCFCPKIEVLYGGLERNIEQFWMNYLHRFSLIRNFWQCFGSGSS